MTKLSYDEKYIFNECVKELMDAEFSPRDLADVLGGASPPEPTTDA